MYGIENYWGFVLASILLNLTPGSDTIYILTRSIGEGFKSGIMSAFGILSGIFLHILAVSLGLAQIIAHSPTLFELIKYAGAFYLIYLGIKSWRTHFEVKSDQLQKLPLKKIYVQGVFTNLLNPKVVLFFLALLPQFVSIGTQNTFLPFLLLGLTFLTTSTIWCSILVVSSAQVGNLLRKNQTIGKLMNRICGIVFVSLGLKMALSR